MIAIVRPARITSPAATILSDAGRPAMWTERLEVAIQSG
jgi:hypothetical protein